MMCDSSRWPWYLVAGPTQFLLSRQGQANVINRCNLLLCFLRNHKKNLIKITQSPKFSLWISQFTKSIFSFTIQNYHKYLIAVLIKSVLVKNNINMNIRTTWTICEQEHLDNVNALVTWTSCKHELSDNINNLTTKNLLTSPTCCWRHRYEMRPAPPGERITAEGGSGQSPRSQKGSRGRWFWW